MILQRYTFGSKSQPVSPFKKLYSCCLWYCKDIHLEANHNNVFDLADIKTLLMILQRYTFGSKSQRNYSTSYKRWCCLWYCKDIHLEANHNLLYREKLPKFAAYDIAKIYIWKQITTCYIVRNFQNSLLMILQRYTFGSKSQRFCQCSKF